MVKLIQCKIIILGAERRIMYYNKEVPKVNYVPASPRQKIKPECKSDLIYEDLHCSVSWAIQCSLESQKDRQHKDIFLSWLTASEALLTAAFWALGNSMKNPNGHPVICNSHIESSTRRSGGVWSICSPILREPRKDRVGRDRDLVCFDSCVKVIAPLLLKTSFWAVPFFSAKCIMILTRL